MLRVVVFALAASALPALSIQQLAAQSPASPAPETAPAPQPPPVAEEPCPVPEPEPPTPPHSLLNSWLGFTGPTRALGDLPGLDGSFAGPGGMGGLAGFQLVPGSSYQATWYPSQPVTGQPTHVGFERQNLAVGFPLWSDDCNYISARVRVGMELFQSNAVLPISQVPMPEQLWNVSLGLSGGHRFENGWTVGGGFSVGSASDKPFESIDTINVGLNAFLRIPAGDRDSWLFTLTYSPLNQVSFPLPGVSYLWMPADWLTVNLGLPLIVIYRPTESWILEASYMLLTNVHARSTYLLTDQIRLWAGYDWSYESHYLSVNSPLVDTNNGFARFFYYEQRLSTGIHFSLTPHCGLDFLGGYAFDRDFQLGKSLSGASADRINVEAGPFVQAQLRLRW
jgi:hypothetical protein